MIIKNYGGKQSIRIGRCVDSRSYPKISCDISTLPDCTSMAFLSFRARSFTVLKQRQVEYQLWNVQYFSPEGGLKARIGETPQTAGANEFQIEKRAE